MLVCDSVCVCARVCLLNRKKPMLTKRMAKCEITRRRMGHNEKEIMASEITGSSCHLLGLWTIKWVTTWKI